MKPYPYQLQAIKKIDKDKQLVVLPSGSGKTNTVAFDINKKRPSTFLFVVHRYDIIIQTIKVFKKICGKWLEDKDIGIINQDHKDWDKPYLFATVQTLIKSLDKLDPNSIQYLVIDEYHHVAAESYIKILEYFKPKTLVGLTATPFRLDNQDILKYIDNNISITMDLFEGIEKDILAPFHYIGLWDNIDYSEIRWSGYSYNISDLDKKLIIHKRDEEVIKEYKNRILPEKRLTIAFCNSVDHVNRIVEKFRKHGIKAIGITYKEKPEYRKQRLEEFRRGYYDILFTRDVLNEGVDFPECTALMFLRPTVSKTVFFQQLGRGLRKKEGKKDVLVLDYIGNYYKAFERNNWLKVTPSSGEITGERIKPYYEYSPKIKIEFDHKVVNLMEIQKKEFRSWKRVTKEEIYKDYINCCEKEGKILSGYEYGRSSYATISYGTLCNQFGSFKKFIAEYNIDYERLFKSPPLFHYCNDKQKLIDNFKKVKEKFNNEKLINKKDPISNNPTYKYINSPENSRYGTQSYERVWGNYHNFLVETKQIEDSIFKINMTRDEKRIKEAVKKLQKKLGRKYISKTEWRKEYSALGRYIIDHKGFGYFRRKFGIPEKYSGKCKICSKEFSSYITTKRFCGRKCELKGWYIENTGAKRDKERQNKLKIITQCSICGKDYHPYQMFDRIRYSRYCSRKCMAVNAYRLKKQRVN
jgi:superfamily II DNA or RNA helicase